MNTGTLTAPADLPKAKEQVEAIGFLDLDIDPTLDLFAEIEKLKKEKNAVILAHYYQEPDIQDVADYIGSTTGLLKYTQNNEAKEFIVATEAGILHQMMKASPDKTFIPAPPDNSCACNDCPHMKRNTLEKIYLCMKYELPDIIMDEDLRKAALKPIQRMMEISAAAGL